MIRNVWERRMSGSGSLMHRIYRLICVFLAAADTVATTAATTVCSSSYAYNSACLLLHQIIILPHIHHCIIIHPLPNQACRLPHQTFWCIMLSHILRWRSFRHSRIGSHNYVLRHPVLKVWSTCWHQARKRLRGLFFDGWIIKQSGAGCFLMD